MFRWLLGAIQQGSTVLHVVGHIVVVVLGLHTHHDDSMAPAMHLVLEDPHLGSKHVHHAQVAPGWLLVPFEAACTAYQHSNC